MRPRGAQLPTMRDIFLPAVVSLAVPLALLSTTDEFKGGDEPPQPAAALTVSGDEDAMAPRAILVFGAGAHPPPPALPFARPPARAAAAAPPLLRRS